MRSRALPALLAVVALVGAGLAVWPELRSTPSESAAPAAATPVFSPRRVPVLLSHYAADAHLSMSLDRLTADAALGPAQQQSCLSVVDAGGRTVYSRNAST